LLLKPENWASNEMMYCEGRATVPTRLLAAIWYELVE
jgi:hypothetical protein